jgi:ankyrin repeat protein
MWTNKDPKPCPDCDEFDCKGRCCPNCSGIPEDILKSYHSSDRIHRLNKCTCQDESDSQDESCGQASYYPDTRSESDGVEYCDLHDQCVEIGGCRMCLKESEMNKAIICLGDFMVILDTFKEFRPRYKRPYHDRKKGCLNCRNLVAKYSGAETEVEKEKLKELQTSCRFSNHPSIRCPFQCETGDKLPKDISVQMRDFMNFHPDVLPQLKQLAEMIRFGVPRTFEQLDMLIFGMSRHFFNQSIFLFHTVREEKIELARYLIWNGISALEYAMYDNDLDSVKRLFDLGDCQTDCFFDCENHSRNDLMYAVDDFNYEKARFLLELPTISDYINKANNLGKTALFYAIESKSLYWKSNCEHLELINLLIEKGADVNHVDNDGKTCLNYIIEAAIDNYYGIDSYFSIVNLLIERGANINSANNIGKTCLHYVVDAAVLNNYNKDSCLKIVNWLIENGADVNYLDDSGNTCLYYLTSNQASIDRLQDIKRCLFPHLRHFVFPHLDHAPQIPMP